MSLISWGLHFGCSELLTGGRQQTGWDRVAAWFTPYPRFWIPSSENTSCHPPRRPPSSLPTRASYDSDDPRAMHNCTSDGCGGFVRLWKCPFPRRHPLKNRFHRDALPVRVPLSSPLREFAASALGWDARELSASNKLFGEIRGTASREIRRMTSSFRAANIVRLPPHPVLPAFDEPLIALMLLRLFPGQNLVSIGRGSRGWTQPTSLLPRWRGKPVSLRMLSSIQSDSLLT
jgi:hypothetical protein